jgi:predicted amino acid-binding ACT domain protein
MGFDEVVRIWRRRAGLTAGLIVLALLGCAAALVWFPATYQSQASVVLLASKSVSRLTGGNPYLSFTPSLSLTADVVSRALTGPAVGERLASAGFTDSYTVAPPEYTTTTTGSVLVITVTGHDPLAVQGTLRAVMAQVRIALAQIQAGIRPRDRITVATLASSPQAVLAGSETARPIVLALVVGLLAALGLPVIIDGRLRRRGIRRASPVPDGADEPTAQLADGWSGIGLR